MVFMLEKLFFWGGSSMQARHRQYPQREASSAPRVKDWLRAALPGG